MEFIGNFFVVASQVVTLFLLIGVGFVLAKLGALRPDGVSQMSTLALCVVTPCIMIRSFETERTPEILQILHRQQTHQRLHVGLRVAQRPQQLDGRIKLLCDEMGSSARLH